MYLSLSKTLKKFGGARLGLGLRITKKNAIWMSFIYLFVLLLQLSWYFIIFAFWLYYMMFRGIFKLIKRIISRSNGRSTETAADDDKQINENSVENIILEENPAVPEEKASADKDRIAGAHTVKICVYCGTENAEDAETCIGCNATEFQHRCESCGTLFNGMYCHNCGTKVGAYRSLEHIENDNAIAEEDAPQVKKKKVTVATVLFWIIFMPAMATFAVWKSSWGKKKKIIAIVAVWILYFAVLGSGRISESTTRAINTDDTIVPIATETTEEISSAIVTAVPAAEESVIVSEADEAATEENTEIVVEPEVIIPIDNLILEKDIYETTVGTTFEIKYTCLPDDANYKDVEFTASNSLVRIEDGIIHSVDAGETEITISQSDKELARFKVISSYAEVEAVSFTEMESLGIGVSAEMSVDVYPSNGNWEDISFTSSNTKILEISDTGTPGHITVKGLSDGTAAITAIIKNSETTITSGTINVYEVLPTEMQITIDNPNLHAGESGMAAVSFIPEETSNKTVTWKSDNPKIVKISKDGSFEAVSVGSAMLTGTHKTGVSASVTINVLPIDVASISVSSTWNQGESFSRGQKQNLTASVEPENATDKNVVWSSSDESIATVNNKGVVTAVAAGNVEITATSSNGVACSYPITVNLSPQKFSVTITTELIENNHVGSNWSYGFCLNDVAIVSGSTVTLIPGNEFTVTATITDNDNNPDVGSDSRTYTLTDDFCIKGFVYDGTVLVRENGGRYKGKYATWNVRIIFTPIS